METCRGWKLLEGSSLLTVKWFERQQVPQEIESDDEAIEHESAEEENGRYIEN